MAPTLPRVPLAVPCCPVHTFSVSVLYPGTRSAVPLACVGASVWTTSSPAAAAHESHALRPAGSVALGRHPDVHRRVPRVTPGPAEITLC